MSNTLQPTMGDIINDATKSTITSRKRINAKAKELGIYVSPKSTAKPKRKANPKAKAEPKPKPLKGQAKWDKMKESIHAWKKDESGNFVPDRD